MKPSYTYSPQMRASAVAALKYQLDANRNLMLVLVVAFGAMIFSVGAETLLFWNCQDPPPKGILTGIASGLILVMLVLGTIIHALMVYRHGRLVGSMTAMWFLIPPFVWLIGTAPIVAYLFLLYW